LDPDPYWPPSGSRSVKNEYGSETLVISDVCQPQIFFTSANLKSANFYKILHNFVSKQL
jgi:hypothetical protein